MVLWPDDCHLLLPHNFLAGNLPPIKKIYFQPGEVLFGQLPPDQVLPEKGLNLAGENCPRGDCPRFKLGGSSPLVGSCPGVYGACHVWNIWPRLTYSDTAWNIHFCCGGLKMTFHLLKMGGSIQTSQCNYQYMWHTMFNFYRIAQWLGRNKQAFRFHLLSTLDATLGSVMDPEGVMLVHMHPLPNKNIESQFVPLLLYQGYLTVDCFLWELFHHFLPRSFKWLTQ